MVNSDGSVYHIAMKPENLADTVFVVGDPNRVQAFARHLSGIDHIASNREFASVTGYYGNRRVTALSTGIGTDNCDIVLHELDALANFDLQTRQRNPVHRRLSIVRLGTSGAIQPDVPLGSYALTTHAVGLDNLLYFYRDWETVTEPGLTRAFLQTAAWPAALSNPYFVEGTPALVEALSVRAVTGMTVTAPGFYGPQGRYLRLGLADPDMVEKLRNFNHEGRRIINFEMETSAIYGLGRLMGHDTATICAVIANRATGEYMADHHGVVADLVAYVLERLAGDPLRSGAHNAPDPGRDLVSE